MFLKSHSKVLLALGSLALVAAALSADIGTPYRPTDKAFYADQAQVNFVRPGLVIKIVGATVANDGTVTATVTLADPKGAPLDRLGVYSPGNISVSFLLAYIPQGWTSWYSYITRQRTGTLGTVDQVTGENTGTWTQLAEGRYSYVFTKKIPGFDATLTHGVAAYGTRTLTDLGFSNSWSDTLYTFVPNGSAVKTVRDIVRTSSCNKCHDALALHGGNRRSVEVCVVCHNTQTMDPNYPVTADFKVMVHKIHMGSSLPSVVAGGKYIVSGADYSTVVHPSPTNACEVCHEPKSVSGATQADNWKTNPSRDACGSCHDDVEFQTGKNHVNLPVFSDKECKNCHIPTGEAEFDASITGAHTVGTKSAMLPGVVFSFVSTTNVAPGQSPTVTFTVKDNQGNPVVLSTLTSLRIFMGGPSSDIAGYIREDVRAAAVDQGGGQFAYTFTGKMPANAAGTWMFSCEGYRTTTLLKGTLKERSVRDLVANKQFFAGVNGATPVPRRTIVSTAACEKCHYSLSFHGGNRNKVEMCTLCHSPSLVAGGRSYNLTNFLHEVHAEEVRYPGNIRNCAQCHVNNSQNLPLSDALLNVTNPVAKVNPTPPTTNACLACHNTTSAWTHAQANTTSLGESCEVCHGASAEYSVAKVHAQ